MAGRSRGFAIGGLALIPAMLALAAQAQEVPSPGQVEDTLSQPPPLQTPSLPVLEGQGAAPRPAAPPVDGAVTFTLKRIGFSGNSAYTATALHELIKDYENRPITLADAYAAADVVTAYYVSNGYTLASVSVPPQKVSDGTLTLEVVEGHIGAVTFDNPGSHSESRLRQYTAGLRTGAIYRSDELEAALLQLNEIPGFSARGVVRPGKAFGTSDVIIRSAEDKFDGVVSLDNYGREPVGELRLTAAAGFNNPFGIEDRLQLMALGSEDGLLKYGALKYSLPLGGAGTRLELSYSHADFEVDSAIPAEGKSDYGAIQVTHPLTLTRNEIARVSAGVSTSKSESEIAGIPASGTDITLLELGYLYVLRSNSAVTQFNLGLATNFDDMTRAELNSGDTPIDGKQMLRAELDLQHLQSLGAGFAALIHLAGVYSPDPLVDTQQFSIGGPDSVRGYPAAEVRGDGGLLASLTIQHPFRFTSSVFTPRIFADYGSVTRKDPNPGVDSSDHLASVGVGFDWGYRGFTVKLDWSEPTDDHVLTPGSEGRISNGDNGRLFTAISASF